MAAALKEWPGQVSPPPDGVNSHISAKDFGFSYGPHQSLRVGRN